MSAPYRRSDLAQRYRNDCPVSTPCPPRKVTCAPGSRGPSRLDTKLGAKNSLGSLQNVAKIPRARPGTAQLRRRLGQQLGCTSVRYVLAGLVFPDPLPQGIRPEMLAPRLLKRLLMLLPSNVAPPAIASAIKIVSIAYSVAVTRLSSRHRRLSRPSRCNPSSSNIPGDRLGRPPPT